MVLQSTLQSSHHTILAGGQTGPWTVGCWEPEAPLDAKEFEVAIPL